MPLPDYNGNSLVNLMSSLGRAMGVEINDYSVLSSLSPDEINQNKNIVLLVIDGLGYDYLLNHAKGSVLQQHLKSRMTSVFPSTTASAITTFMTGQAPQQHGLTGWHTYLKELGCVTAVLPFRPRVGCMGFDNQHIDIQQLYGLTSMFDMIDRPAYIVMPEWIIHSEYTSVHSGSARPYGYNSLTQCFQYIDKTIKDSAPSKYIYAYWPDFDRLCHEFGCHSSQVKTHFAALDEAFEILLGSIKGTNTCVIVTADHGFIDTEASRVISLSHYPVMQDALVLPLCGEPRVAYCYVHPDKQQSFIDCAKSELVDYAELLPSKQLIEQGYFGQGAVHPRLSDRIGHYTLLMKENYVFKDRLIGESPFINIGVHGGTSQQEMYVPLIVAQC